MNAGQEDLLQKAQQWGFVCRRSEQTLWRIHQPDPVNQWYLEQDQESSGQLEACRWVLYVGGTPQIRFQLAEAIQFLQRQISHQ